jgi:ABC-type multidrug transport system fused ATPase/permease subunit
MVTKRPLVYWVKSSSVKLQLLLITAIIVTVGARVLPLEMQKRIVNQAIGTRNGDLLIIYCGLYLGSVLIAGGLKYAINSLEAYIGQHALSRMRKELYAHILTLPLDFFRRSSPGMVVSSLVTEVAVIGDFIGQAVAAPLINLLTLGAFLIYMFSLNPTMCGVSLLVYPIIILIVPRLQALSNEANKRRVDITRKISSVIGESISGIHEIHGNGSYHIENGKYGKFVDQLLKTRIAWIMYKNGIKVLNNLFQNLGPLIIFLIGGYFVIKGRLDLGALVAFLSAQEKLYDPWKELMDYYQLYQDTQVSYYRIMEYFDVPPEHVQEPVDREPFTFHGAISVKNLSFATSGGIQLLKGINLDLEPGEQLALIGISGSGKSTLARCLGQLYRYTGGKALIDGHDINELTKMDITRNIGIVPQAPFIFDGSVRENLLYSCKASVGENGAADQEKLPTLDETIMAIQQVGLFVDVLQFGLNTILQKDQEMLIAKLIKIRSAFQTGFGEELSPYVEFFDNQRYLYFSSIAANVIFGNPNSDDFAPERLPGNPYFLDFLAESRLSLPLLNLGRELANQTVDILGNIPFDEAFFLQSPIPMDEFQSYVDLVGRSGKRPLGQVTDEDRIMLLKPALRFIPGMHKIASMPHQLEQLILESRFLFMERISKDHPEAISFYRMDEYIYSQTILENILFGKPRSDHAKARERISQSVVRLLIEEDLLERIVEIGMDFQVGSMGDKLSGGQRQKLAIARILLKDPPILIMDEATSALDNASQQRILNLLETRWKGRSTLVSVVHRLDTIKNYEKVAVMKAGSIVEMGTYEELIAKKGLLYGLIHGTQGRA